MFGKRLRNQRGTILVIFAFCLVGLLGIAALVVDVGRLHLAKQRAQNLADASALAGVWELDGKTIPLSWDTRAISVADSLAGRNNAPAGTFWQVKPTGNGEGSNVSVSFPVGTIPGTSVSVQSGQAIQVECKVDVDFTFGRAISDLTGGSRTAVAVAVRQPWQGAEGPIPVGFSPDMLLLQTGDQFSAAIKHELRPGNFGAVVLPGDDGKKSTYEARLAGDPDLPPVDLMDIVTDDVGKREGNINKETGDGLATRIGTDTTTWDQWVTAGMPDDCPRLVIMPVVAGDGSLAVIGFVGFFIEDPLPDNKPGDGNEDPLLYGRFVSGTTSAGVTKWELYNPSQGTAPNVEIRLIK